MEEFEEKDVFFAEDDVVLVENGVAKDYVSDPNKPKRKKKRKNNAVPIDIPGNKENLHGNCAEMDKETELVPPHLIIGRRVYARKMAFSVCSGNGRTLKGRDLSQVRNSVLRMTGFLET